MSNVFLSIIIPFWEADILHVINFLHTIDNQKHINWNEVEVIYSSSSTDIDPLVNICFQHFKPIFAGKRMFCSGPGQSREIGMSIATGDYIVMCDADDGLVDVDSLFKLISEIRTQTASGNTDAIVFTVSYVDNGSMSILDARVSRTIPINVWMYAYRRESLNRLQIHFHPHCRYCEDTYFMCRAIMLGLTYIYSDVCWYKHFKRNGSIIESTLPEGPQFLQDEYMSSISFAQEFSNSGINSIVWQWMLLLYVDYFAGRWLETNGFENWSVEEKRVQIYNFISWTMIVWPILLQNGFDISTLSKRSLDLVKKAQSGDLI